MAIRVVQFCSPNRKIKTPRDTNSLEIPQRFERQRKSKAIKAFVVLLGLGIMILFSANSNFNQAEALRKELLNDSMEHGAEVELFGDVV